MWEMPCFCAFAAAAAAATAAAACVGPYKGDKQHILAKSHLVCCQFSS